MLARAIAILIVVVSVSANGLTGAAAGDFTR